MEKVVADQLMMEKLDRVAGPVDIVAPDGRVMGKYIPRIPIPPELDIDIQYEEMMRIVNDPTIKWVPAKEVEARLRGLL